MKFDADLIVTIKIMYGLLGCDSLLSWRWWQQLLPEHWHISDYMASHPRRPQCSYSLPWDIQLSQNQRSLIWSTFVAVIFDQYRRIIFAWNSEDSSPSTTLWWNLFFSFGDEIFIELLWSGIALNCKWNTVQDVDPSHSVRLYHGGTGCHVPAASASTSRFSFCHQLHLQHLAGGFLVILIGLHIALDCFLVKLPLHHITSPAAHYKTPYEDSDLLFNHYYDALQLSV
jgi:hypothetical protein